MPIVQSGLRAGQYAAPHLCAERPFDNSMVHPDFSSCLIALRTSFLGWMLLAMAGRVPTGCDRSDLPERGQREAREEKLA